MFKKIVDCRCYILSIYTKMKRGSVKKAGSRLVNVYFPEAVLPVIDEAVKELDTDRSKFIRKAVREKLERSGFKTKTLALQ